MHSCASAPTLPCSDSPHANPSFLPFCPSPRRAPTQSPSPSNPIPASSRFLLPHAVLLPSLHPLLTQALQPSPAPPHLSALSLCRPQAPSSPSSLPLKPSAPSGAQPFSGLAQGQEYCRRHWTLAAVPCQCQPVLRCKVAPFIDVHPNSMAPENAGCFTQCYMQQSSCVYIATRPCI